MSALDPSAAAALVAAATAAVPADAPDWTGQVRARAFELLRLVPDVVERAEVLAGCRPVTGVILSVRDVSGRAVITIRPTMGDTEEGKTEDFRTPWLNEPDGAAMAARARSLIGHHCRFGKRLDVAGADKKVRMCEWIEDLGPDDDSRFANHDSRIASHYKRPESRRAAELPSTRAPEQGQLPTSKDLGSSPSGPVALCSDSYRKAILSMARQLLVDEDKRNAFAQWRTAAGIPVLNDPSLTAEQAARVRTFLAGLYDQVGGAA